MQVGGSAHGIYQALDPRADLSETDLACFQHGCKKWLKFIQSTKNTGRHRNWAGGALDGARSWLLFYEEMVEQYKWLKAIYREVQGNVRWRG